ncbi:hypothetical protein FNV43_RR04282 [Rhamnella rubrinervis]|uniref:Uncharacterized protein n=1 Tax=Rhamnella rubrinervis TaxID=2594499 RepID=A0A8K0HJ99_9ROSA|nr:hypothetical protein FNV43_RR04282 [Rhamnella rubrinervis]
MYSVRSIAHWERLSGRLHPDALNDNLQNRKWVSGGAGVDAGAYPPTPKSGIDPWKMINNTKMELREVKGRKVMLKAWGRSALTELRVKVAFSLMPIWMRPAGHSADNVGIQRVERRHVDTPDNLFRRGE